MNANVKSYKKECAWKRSCSPIGSVYFGNAVSLKYTLPMGAHDLGGGSEDICIRLARPGDSFLPFGGDTEEAPDSGEVVYAVGDQVRTRRWTWRQSEHGKITAASSDIFFPIDGFTDFNRERVIAARDELAGPYYAHLRL